MVQNGGVNRNFEWRYLRYKCAEPRQNEGALRYMCRLYFCRAVLARSQPFQRYATSKLRNTDADISVFVSDHLEMAGGSATSKRTPHAHTLLNSTQFFALFRTVKELGAESQPLQIGNHHNIVPTSVTVGATLQQLQNLLEPPFCLWQYLGPGNWTQSTQGYVLAFCPRELQISHPMQSYE
jgi:hypothetical protein